MRTEVPVGVGVGVARAVDVGVAVGVVPVVVTVVLGVLGVPLDFKKKIKTTTTMMSSRIPPRIM